MTLLEQSKRLKDFANSSECPKFKRSLIICEADKLLSQHYKDWIDSVPNPFSYELLKGERIEIINGLPLRPIYDIDRNNKRMSATQWCVNRKNRIYPKVIQLIKGREVREFSDIYHVARTFKIAPSMVRDCINNKCDKLELKFKQLKNN